MTESPSRYPLLIFAEPTSAAREILGQNPTRSRLRRPSAEQQAQRLRGKWAALEQALENRAATLTPDLQGIDPELVVVFEIIGDVADFYRAVQQINGFEYLAEIDEPDVDGDGVFLVNGDEEELFDGTLFLLASNQVALVEVLELWDQYTTDETAAFPRGLGRWKDVFRLLRDVRRWSPRDRLLGTGAIEDFRERQAAGQESVPAEIELWFRADAAKRNQAEQTVRNLVFAASGDVITSAAIPEIAYHALLVHLPIDSISPLLTNDDEFIELIRAEEIAFVRPESQAAVTLPAVEASAESFPVEFTAQELGEPLVGILDGVPLVRHELLVNRVEFDDPDNWEAGVPTDDRRHGTAIASLVLHGDGNQDEASLSRKVHIRPVLLPDGSGQERIPHDQLAIDLIHRAVVDMVDPDHNPTAPTVRAINLSLGDASSQLATSISPWARLLDWLSYRYKILFIISAGNHVVPLVYPLGSEQFRNLTPNERRGATFRLLVDGAQHRRLLSPSEAMNCLCVGAVHDDGCTNWAIGNREDLLPNDASRSRKYPSPLSAVGMGYRRSIKPDILAPGGRLLFRTLPLGGNPPRTIARPALGTLPPGLLVATPGGQIGALNATRYFHGTSGAAALISHYCGLIMEMLNDLETPTDTQIDPDYFAVLAKTLLVHTAYLPPESNELREAFGAMHSERLKDAVSRFYGYGVVRPRRAIACVERRATVLGWGYLDNNEADIFSFPLPPSLSGKPIPRRVAITAAYLSPIRARDRRHRAAQLYIQPNVAALRARRKDVNWRSVRRGTIQHEVFDGSHAAAFVDGDMLEVQVNCRSLVGKLPGPVQYGLAVTLETSEQSTLPIYTEVAERIRLEARARIRGA